MIKRVRQLSLSRTPNPESLEEKANTNRGLLSQRRSYTGSTGLLWCHRHQCHLGTEDVPRGSLPQPLQSRALIHRYSISIAIAQPQVVFSRGVAFGGGFRDPIGSGFAVLSNPMSGLVSH